MTDCEESECEDKLEGRKRKDKGRKAREEKERQEASRKGPGAERGYVTILYSAPRDWPPFWPHTVSVPCQSTPLWPDWSIHPVWYFGHPCFVKYYTLIHHGIKA